MVEKNKENHFFNFIFWQINYGKIKKRTNFERAKTYEDVDQFA